MTVAKTAFSFASVAAVMAISNFAVAPLAGAADAKVTHCYGVNSCKGMSDCKTAQNECRGQNTCKGHGFKEMTAQACTDAGGSLTPKG